jgi:hypothetical protein
VKSKSIRLTANSYALLALLDQLDEATSYEIKQAIEKSIANLTAAPPQLRDEHALKAFAGAPRQPLLEERAAWHREKLAELQAYLDEVRDSEGWESSERVLVAGVAYHRKMLELLDQVEGPDGTA